MAKNKQANSNNETTDVSKKTKTNGNAEESNSLVAVVVAFVAIIIIAGSIGAFLLFVKIKKNYVEPFLQNQTKVAAPTATLPQENDTADDALILAGTEPIGIGETLPIASDSSDTTDDTTTPEPPVVPPVPETPEVPEPEKVGSYDFEGVIAEMDGAMNTAFDTTFNNTIFSNDYFGFD